MLMLYKRSTCYYYCHLTGTERWRHLPKIRAGEKQYRGDEIYSIRCSNTYPTLFVEWQIHFTVPSLQLISFTIIGNLRALPGPIIAFTKYFSSFIVSYLFIYLFMVKIQAVTDKIWARAGCRLYLPVCGWLYFEAISMELTKISLNQILEHLFNKVVNLYQ